MKASSIIGVATAVLGAMVVLAGMGFAVQAMLRARLWQQANARVLSATLESRSDSDNDRRYFAVYQFQYNAGGERRTSTLQSNMQTNSEAAIRDRLARHPAGTERTIYYNPVKPGEIAFEVGTGSMGMAFGFVMMGLIFLIAGGLLWYGSQPAAW